MEVSDRKRPKSQQKNLTHILQLKEKKQGKNFSIESPFMGMLFPQKKNA